MNNCNLRLGSTFSSLALEYGYKKCTWGIIWLEFIWVKTYTCDICGKAFRKRRSWRGTLELFITELHNKNIKWFSAIFTCIVTYTVMNSSNMPLQLHSFPKAFPQMSQVKWILIIWCPKCTFYIHFLVPNSMLFL